MSVWQTGGGREREGAREEGRGSLSFIFSPFFPRNLTAMRSRYDIGIHSFYGHIITFNRFPNRLSMFNKKKNRKWKPVFFPEKTQSMINIKKDFAVTEACYFCVYLTSSYQTTRLNSATQNMSHFQTLTHKKWKSISNKDEKALFLGLSQMVLIEFHLLN